MKKTICVVLCAIVAGGTFFSYAQSPVSGAELPKSAAKSRHLQKPFSLGLDAGAVASLYENAFSYSKNGRALGLINFHKGIEFGYDFSVPFGLRASIAMDRNSGACNVMETGNGKGFYPYKFTSINGFVDLVLHLRKNEESILDPKLFLGGGYAYTYNYTDSGHPWQKVDDPSHAWGFRLGGMLEWRVLQFLGLTVELCGEAYTDHYNGLEPGKKDQSQVDGYAGFPLDLRGIVSLGVLFYL